MIVIDEKLLASFRQSGRCELCGKFCRRREAHHVWQRGVGGGNRLDLRPNLIALGATQSFMCRCHSDIHSGKIKRETVIAAVAEREGATPELLAEWIYAVRRLAKGERMPDFPGRPIPPEAGLDCTVNVPPF